MAAATQRRAGGQPPLRRASARALVRAAAGVRGAAEPRGEGGIDPFSGGPALPANQWAKRRRSSAQGRGKKRWRSSRWSQSSSARRGRGSAVGGRRPAGAASRRSCRSAGGERIGPALPLGIDLPQGAARHLRHRRRRCRSGRTGRGSPGPLLPLGADALAVELEERSDVGPVGEGEAVLELARSAPAAGSRSR